jgi:dTDP-4-dehydrorhamnose 3,5-epimerase-like enzyme
MRVTTPVVQAAPGQERINGVRTKTLRAIPDERGWLMEILRRDETDLLPVFGHPDEYRLAPHGTLPYDWTRRNG